MNTSVTSGGIAKAAAAAAVVAATASLSTSAAHAAENRIAIIGSGYGGAIAALKLAQMGRNVDLIEMGADWEKMPKGRNGKVFTAMTQPSERSMWFKDKTQMPLERFIGIPIDQKIGRAAGVLDVEDFGAMKIYVGRGVGGGSLVNGGMAVTPSKSFFSSVMNMIDADEMYQTYFPRVNDALMVGLPPKDIIATSKYYQFTRVGVRQGKKAGIRHQVVPNVYDWDYMRRENFKREIRSGLGGQVIFGNDHGKRSLPKSILKEALATGRVNLKSLTEVEAIKQNSDGTFTLTTKTIDFDGRVVVVDSGATYDRVILAAGSVGTTRLLMKAQSEGSIKNLPSEIGKGWGPNGNIMVARNLGTGADMGTHHAGIPAIGLIDWDDSENSVFAELAPFPVPVIETNVALYLAITNNPNLGEFSWDAEAKKLDLNWNSQLAQPSITAATNFMNRLNQANPGSSTASGFFSDGKQFADYFSYHPLGGAVLGQATDLNGEVKNVPGLFVMDGSLIPGKIGVNPFVTIAALAERNMDKLISAKRF